MLALIASMRSGDVTDNEIAERFSVASSLADSLEEFAVMDEMQGLLKDGVHGVVDARVPGAQGRAVGGDGGDARARLPADAGELAAGVDRLIVGEVAGDAERPDLVVGEGSGLGPSVAAVVADEHGKALRRGQARDVGFSVDFGQHVLELRVQHGAVDRGTR